MTNWAARKVVGLIMASIWSGSAPSIPAALGQNPYTVCIGDLCQYPSYMNLGCSFRATHHDSTDEEAAKLVCMVKNNYEKYTYVRTATMKGGRCGAIYVQVRCQ